MLTRTLTASVAASVAAPSATLSIMSSASEDSRPAFARNFTSPADALMLCSCLILANSVPRTSSLLIHERMMSSVRYDGAMRTLR